MLEGQFWDDGSVVGVTVPWDVLSELRLDPDPAPTYPHACPTQAIRNPTTRTRTSSPVKMGWGINELLGSDSEFTEKAEMMRWHQNTSSSVQHNIRKPTKPPRTTADWELRVLENKMTGIEVDLFIFNCPGIIRPNHSTAVISPHKNSKSKLRRKFVNKICWLNASDFFSDVSGIDPTYAYIYICTNLASCLEWGTSISLLLFHLFFENGQKGEQECLEDSEWDFSKWSSEWRCNQRLVSISSKFSWWQLWLICRGERAPEDFLHRVWWT